MVSSVCLGDFHPWNQWELDQTVVYRDTRVPKYILDQTTGRRYLNESKGTVRMKCFLLLLGTPIVHSIGLIVNVAYRALRLLTLYHFWKDIGEDIHYDFGARVYDAGTDFLRICTSQIAFFGLQVAALYGVLTPYNGRKLYATIERAQYGRSILAPCFQPEPKYHLMGGDIEMQNAY